MTGRRVDRRCARVAAGGLVVLLAACSGGPGSDATADPQAPGPLRAYLQAAGSEVTTAEGYVAHQRAREEAIAACMHERGFEYWPMVPTVEDVDVPTGPPRGSPEFLSQYGYGVWIRTPDEGMSATVDGSGNWDYRQLMGEAEGLAYDEAMYGPLLSVDASGTQSFGDGGCFGVEADGLEGDPRAEEFRELDSDAQRFLVELDLDPAFDGLDEEWSACLAESGFRFASPGAAAQSVRNESAAWAEQHQYPPGDVGQRIAAEHALADADLACRERVDYAARHTAIAHRLEQEYVDAHRAELDAWLAAVTEAQQ